MLKRALGHGFPRKQAINQVEDGLAALVGAAGSVALRVERDGDGGIFRCEHGRGFNRLQQFSKRLSELNRITRPFP